MYTLGTGCLMVLEISHSRMERQKKKSPICIVNVFLFKTDKKKQVFSTVSGKHLL